MDAKRPCPSSAIRPMRRMGLSQTGEFIILCGMTVSGLESGSLYGFFGAVLVAYLYEKYAAQKARNYLMHSMSVSQNKYLLGLLPNWHETTSATWVKTGLTPSPRYKSRYEP